MTNEYLDPSLNRVVDGVTARAEDVNTLRDEAAAGFELLPTSAQMKRGTIGYAVDTGLVNACVVDLPYVPSGYVDGLRVSFRPLFTNTGATTINVNGLGVKSIRLTEGSPTSAGDLNADIPVDIRYSTATGFFHLAPNSTVDALAAEAAAIAADASADAAAISEANAALIAAGVSATSATSWTPVVGATETFTIQAGKQFVPTTFIEFASSSNPSDYGWGQVVSYSGTTIVANILVAAGATPHTDWIVSLSGSRGPTGAQGIPGANSPDLYAFIAANG